MRQLPGHSAGGRDTLSVVQRGIRRRKVMMQAHTGANMRIPDLIQEVAPAVAVVTFVPDYSKMKVTRLEDALKAPGAGVSGSGFLVGENRVLTCDHVVEPLVGIPGQAVVLFRSPGSNRPFLCRALSAARNLEMDIALVRIEPPPAGTSPLQMDFSIPRQGADVVAIGAPLPEHTEQRNPAGDHIDVAAHFVLRATRGIIASRIQEDGTFEVDTQFNPGLSGGPVIDIETGRAVGVVQSRRLFPERDTGRLIDSNLGIAKALSSIQELLAELRAMINGKKS